MSSFTRAEFLETEKRRDGRVVYKLINGGFQYDIGYLGSGLSVHVPEGFETDGPSIPGWLLTICRLLEKILPSLVQIKKMMNSAAVHDKLREDLRFKLLETDMIFHMAMKAEGTPKIQREVSALLVRFNKSRVSYQETL